MFKPDFTIITRELLKLWVKERIKPKRSQLRQARFL